MAGKEVVQTTPELGHVRSYHRAFNVEMTIYTIGENTRLWWPIPIRGVFWACGIEILVLAFAHLTGLHSKLLSPDWGFMYIIMPVGFAWLFAGAKPEGRRLHVTLLSWFTRAITGRQTVGGYRRMDRISHLRRTKIKTKEVYAPRTPVRWERWAIAGLLMVFFVFGLFHFLGGSSKAHAAAATSVPQPTHLPTALMRPARAVRPAFPPAQGVTVPTVVPKKHTVIKHHAPTVMHKHMVSHSVPKKVTPPVVHTTTATVAHVVTPPHIQVRSAPVYTPPKVTYVPKPQPQPAPVARRSAPRPQPSPCYPGELGC